MLCQACHRPAPTLLCRHCAGDLRSASDRVLDGGIRVVAAFEHEGPARALVHGLKYRGLVGYADLVADALAARAPALPLVPIPRVWSRRILYGIDPAGEIAVRLARRLQVPVWDILVPPLHGGRRAGRDHRRAAPRFRLRSLIEGPVALVDDVVTTGGTVRSAARALGAANLGLVLAANVADRCLVRD